MDEILKICKDTKKAGINLRKYSFKTKNKILEEFAKSICENTEYIIKENDKDVKEAKKNGISDVMIDRLMLSKEKIQSIGKAILEIKNQKEIIGEIVEGFTTNDELKISKVRVPFGTICIIYESRPNVTAESIALAIKSSNTIILKSGKEAINSSKAIVDIFKKVLVSLNLDTDIANLVLSIERSDTLSLIKMREYIDVLIPRGGKGLIDFVIDNSNIPVIETGTGNCHLYVDEFADFYIARDILLNGKIQRPSVCNALESLVIHKGVKNEFIKDLIDSLLLNKIEVRGDEKVKKIVDEVILATSEDYKTEFLDYIISVKIVENIDEAIEFINENSTKHSEAIITNNHKNAQKFKEEIDSAVVYVNASTRFTDGGKFGFGGEVGISTQKLHARGPMGIREMTTTKYVVEGNGNIRE